MSDDVMRLAAEVTDRFSGPIRDMTRQLSALNKLSQQQQKEGTAAAKEHIKWFRELHQTTHKLSDEVKGGLTPAMAAFGIGSLSVASAIAAVTKSVIDFGANARNLDNLARFSGFSADAVRGLEELSAGLGSTKADMDTFIKSFSTNMDQFKRYNRGALAEGLFKLGPAGFQFASQLKNAATQAERLNVIFGFLGNNRWSDVQKKILTDAIGLPEAFAHARAGAKQLYEAINKEIKPLDPGWEALARQYNASIALLQTSLGNLALHIGDDMAGSFAHVADIVRKFIDENGPQIQKFFADVGKWVESANWQEFGRDIRDTSHDLGVAATAMNDLVKSTTGWKPLIEGLIALKLAGWLYGVLAPLRVLAGLTAPAWLTSLPTIAAAAGVLTQRSSSGPGSAKTWQDTVDEGRAAGKSFDEISKEQSKKDDAALGWNRWRLNLKNTAPGLTPSDMPAKPLLDVFPGIRDGLAGLHHLKDSLQGEVKKQQELTPGFTPSDKTPYQQLKGLFHKTGYYTAAGPGQGDMGRADPVPSDNLMMGMVSAASPGSPLSVGALAGKVGSALSAQIKSMHVVPAAEAADGIKKMAFTSVGPNPLRAAQSAIKFPTEETLGGSRSTADAVETIAVGTRKGVYDGMWDFYNSYKAVGGAAAPGAAEAIKASLSGTAAAPGAAAGDGGGLGGVHGGAPGGPGEAATEKPPTNTVTLDQVHNAVYGSGGKPGGIDPHAPNAVGHSAAIAQVKAAMIAQGRAEGIPEANLEEASNRLAGEALSESGSLDPNESHDSGMGRGIYGAAGDRRVAMDAWMKAKGFAPDSRAGQAAFMMHEAMTNPRFAATRKILEGATAANRTSAAVNAVTGNFEAPTVINSRIGNVNQAANIPPGAGALDIGSHPIGTEQIPAVAKVAQAAIAAKAGLVSPLGAASGYHPDLASVDPRLREILGASKTSFEAAHPGYTIAATSGRRPNQGPHGSEAGAIDMQIFGPDGKALPNAGKDASGLYTEYAKLNRGEMLARHPELARRFNWGGYFNAGGRGLANPATGEGRADLMHYDLEGNKSYRRAITDQYEKLGSIPPPAVASIAKESAALHGAALREHFGHREQKHTDLLDDARKAGMAGTMQHKVTGRAGVDINLTGFPKGTQTKASSSGIFNEVKLDRGRIPYADTNA